MSSLAVEKLLTLEHTKGMYQKLCKVSPPASHCMWKWFCKLNEVPRPSHHTEKIADYLYSMAGAFGVPATKDKFGNVLFKIPATKGKESAPGIILQGHSDMVGTDAGQGFKFTEMPITSMLKDKVVIDGVTYAPALVADRTTLGADDGQGVATALALMEERDKFVHGPFEVLITTDEEVGMIGANGLDPKVTALAGKYLINIDSEDWGVVTISSAGCAMRCASIPVRREACGPNAVMLKLSLSNMKGGHSGVQIHEGRGSAIKWVVEMLEHSGEHVRLVSMVAGNAHNAVPSHAVVEFVVPKAEAKTVVERIQERFKALCHRFRHVETKTTEGVTGPQLKVEETAADEKVQVAVLADSKNAIHVLQQVPHGVFTWSRDVPNLVESSQNLARVKFAADAKEFGFDIFARSSKNDVLAKLNDQFAAFCAVHGGKCAVEGDDAGGWPAQPDSQLLKELKALYKKNYGAEIKVEAIHAGLENSVIMNKYPHLKLESISIGPTVKGPHTTEETLDVVSAGRIVDLTRDLMTSLAK